MGCEVQRNVSVDLKWRFLGLFPFYFHSLDFDVSLQKAQGFKFAFSCSGIRPWFKIWTSSETDLTFSAALDFTLGPALAEQPTAAVTRTDGKRLQGFAAAPVQTATLSPFQKSLVLALGVDAINYE